MKTTPIRLALSLLAVSLLASSAFAAGVTLKGSGATFPDPLYQKWISEFTKANKDIQIDYQKKGSGTGIKEFTDGVVNFAGSDVAMTDAEIEKVKPGVVLIPATAGSIVLCYNLSGVTKLKLSREAYAGIFLGKITKWNDPSIAKSNAGVKLPDTNITVCYRSDGSGTTGVFTKHLSAINADFKSKLGEGTKVNWPVGQGGPGNDGVAKLISSTDGAIGYVEYGYAKKVKLPAAELENKTGEYVSPTTASGEATLATTQFPGDLLRAWPSDPEGKSVYPIATFTWMLFYKKYDNAAQAEALKKFVKYGLTDGQKFAESLGYIPLPSAVAKKSEAALDNVK